MRLSRETLFGLSGQTGYRQEILQKVSILLSFLDRASRLPSRFALKGGTAINLFFLRIPRLSVDIDINYVGELDRSELQNKGVKFEMLIESVCFEKELSVRNKSCRFASYFV
jgi:predicted nucleotidyltransferase component of viral defense system